MTANLISYHMLESDWRRWSYSSIFNFSSDTPGRNFVTTRIRQFLIIMIKLINLNFLSLWILQRYPGNWGTQILNGTKNCKNCQLGEVPVSASWGTGSKNLTLGRTIFSKFVGGENSHRMIEIFSSIKIFTLSILEKKVSRTLNSFFLYY